MKRFLSGLLIVFSAVVYGQDDDYADLTPQAEKAALPKETAIDLNFSGSNFGGTGGLGLKLGFSINEHLIAGPSLRYQYTWSYNGGNPYNFSVYGGGGFLDYRFYKYLFVGTEVEFLSTPMNYTYVTNSRSLVPVVLVGGGFSCAFSPNFRLNAGLCMTL